MLVESLAPLALLAGVAALLLAAATDIGYRLIPDRWPLVLGIAGMLLRAGSDDSSVAGSLAAALILFALLLAAFAAGLIGGGDVKLASAAALALPPAHVPDLVLAITLAGGVLCCLYLALSRLLPPPGPRPASRLRRLARVEAWRIRGCRPLPYGIAIACGAIFTIHSSLHATVPASPLGFGS